MRDILYPLSCHGCFSLPYDQVLFVRRRVVYTYVLCFVLSRSLAGSVVDTLRKDMGEGMWSLDRKKMC